MRPLVTLVCACVLLLAVAYGHRFDNDPYTIIGVSPSSTTKEIKRAYKKLALELHPDRNDSPDATEKFLKLQKAYEVLSDPTRKAQYDRYGTMEEQPQGGRGQGQYHDFFDFGFGGFGGHGDSFFQNHHITYRMYDSIIAKSFTQPFLIFGYSPYCHFCFRMEGIWKDAVTDLEALGYGIGTINAMTDHHLLERMRVSSLPLLAVVIEGRVIQFRKSYNGMSAKVIRLFARETIPSTFLQRINSHISLKRFLDQWSASNRVSVLMLGSKEEPRLRYLLTAMKYSHMARFAYIHMNSHNEDMRSLKSVLGISCSHCENVLVFKENPEQGDVERLTVTTSQIDSAQLSALIEKHKFLTMPRLSSMQYFDDLCPVSSVSHRHYCVILTVTDSASDQPYVDALRRFVSRFPQSAKVSVVYVYKNKQKAFLADFEQPEDPSGDRRSFLVLWRYEYVKARYAWLTGLWSSDELVEHKSFEALHSKINAIERGQTGLTKNALVGSLVDEYEPSWFTRTSRLIVRGVETAWFYMTKEEALPIVSVLGTFLVIMFVGYALNAFMAADRRNYEQARPRQQSDWHPEDPQSATAQPADTMRRASREQKCFREMEGMIHELRAETYFGLIRLLKPGCRSIIVCVDKDSKDILLPQFARYVRPLRNNKTFSFGFLMVDKNLAWFRSLLEQILPSTSEPPSDTVSQASTLSTNLSENGSTDKTAANGSSTGSIPNPAIKRLRGINEKHVLGTVLILCGYKLYFSMYHPMYKPKATEYYEDVEDDSSDSDAPKASKRKILKQDLNVNNVLSGFPNFLDRLLEGSVPRYYLPEWPDNLK